MKSEIDSVLDNVDWTEENAAISLAERIQDAAAGGITDSKSFAEAVADAIDPTGRLGLLGCLYALVRALSWRDADLFVQSVIAHDAASALKYTLRRYYTMDESNFVRILAETFPCEGVDEDDRYTALAYSIADAIVPCARPLDAVYRSQPSSEQRFLTTFKCSRCGAVNNAAWNSGDTIYRCSSCGRLIRIQAEDVMRAVCVPSSIDIDGD